MLCVGGLAAVGYLHGLSGLLYHDLGPTAANVAIGLVSAMMPGNIQTLPSEILGPSKAGVGFAVLGICGNIGIAATQPLAGVILDSTGSYSLSILSMALFAALCLGSALLVKVK